MEDDESPESEAAQVKVQLSSGKKSRRTLSCLSCQKRKVRCDRVKPCRACCMRGAPTECEYGTTKHDRSFIEQSDLIDQLRAKVKKLEQKLADHNVAPQATAGTANQTPEKFLVKSKAAMMGDKNFATELFLTSKLQRALAASPSPEKMLMEVFVGELINAFAPDPSNIHGRVFDLRSAAEKRIFSPLLSSGFEATALIFVGQRDQSQKFVTAGNNRYQRALKLLQQSVNDPQQCKSTDALTMVVLLTIIEAFKQSSPGAILKHQLGGLELLRLRTPYRHRTGLEQSLFVDLRMFWVTTAIASRKATFLASEAWMTVPWPEDGPQKDILHLLLDVAVEIPAFLGAYDIFKSALWHGEFSQAELVSAQTRLRTTAITLDRRLQLWHSVYATNYELGYLTEIPAEEFITDAEAPRFYSSDTATGRISRPSILVYPDLLLNTTMCLYRALRLVVAGGDNDGLFTVLSSSERYQLAVDICRSMPYFLHNVPGFLVSRLMFVLRVAFDTFSDEMVEREYIKQIFGYVGDKYRFRVFTNQCSESSTALRADASDAASESSDSNSSASG